MVAKIDLSDIEELAALGHALNDERVYDALIELKTPLRSQAVTPVLALVASARLRLRRHPTTAELRASAPADMHDTVASALDFASQLGWDSLAPMIQILAERNTFADAWEEVVAEFNKSIKLGLLDGAEAHKEAVDKLSNLSNVVAQVHAIAEGQRFRSMTERLPGISKDYRARHDRLIPTGIQYLDDVAGGGIGVNDLWIFSATTGSGKTQAMIEIGKNAARAGKRVAFFALEADDREMEARVLFPALLNLFNEKKENRHKYVDPVKWLHGDPATHEMLAPYVAKAEAEAAKDLANLHTMYLGFGKYTAKDLERHVIARSRDSDLIIIDHLGYVALDGDNETKETTDLLFLLRDLVKLGRGVPIITACHTRKSSSQTPKKFAPLVSDRNDIKGSGAIIQCATAVVMFSKVLEPVSLRPSSTAEGSAPLPAMPYPTLVQMQKDRRDGRDMFAAVCSFDVKRRTYAPNYAIGRLTKGDTGWIPLSPPPWATNGTVNILPFGSEIEKK